MCATSGTFKIYNLNLCHRWHIKNKQHTNLTLSINVYSIIMIKKCCQVNKGCKVLVKLLNNT